MLLRSVDRFKQILNHMNTAVTLMPSVKSSKQRAWEDSTEHMELLWAPSDPSQLSTSCSMNTWKDCLWTMMHWAILREMLRVLLFSKTLVSLRLCSAAWLLEQVPARLQTHSIWLNSECRWWERGRQEEVPHSQSNTTNTCLTGSTRLWGMKGPALCSTAL